MKEESLLIRWGIPGVIFFGAFFLFTAIDIFWTRVYYSSYYPQGLHSLINRMNLTELFKDYSLVGIVAFLIGASVPVGFVISQLYYFGYWSSFPFRTRRTVNKVLSQEEIDALQNMIEMDRLIAQEENDDDGRWREWITQNLLRVFYAFMFVFQHLIAYPVSRILAQMIKALRAIIPWLKKFGFQVPERKYKLIRKAEVTKSHYLWVTFMWVCREKADEEERSRIDHLDNIYHGLGATYIAIFLGWTLFYLVHEHLPSQVVVVDTEVWRITLGIVVALFFILWQNRKDVSRHQLLQMNLLFRRANNSMSKKSQMALRLTPKKHATRTSVKAK